MPKKSKDDQANISNFFHHFIRNLVLGFSVLLIVLIIGTLGCYYFENKNWIDSFTNSAMIVSGVGTLDNPQSNAGKIFIAAYSLIGGASFILVIAIVFAPIFHWIFRKVKVEDRDHFKD